MALVYPFDHGLELPLDEVKAILGGKAANIGVMANQLGLPVPPGFVITTDTCLSYLESGWPDGLDEAIREQMSRMEEQTGRRYGDPEDPLLVSVRSGAPISMPGMMDTVLNLGLNRESIAGLAERADRQFAEDCHSRLLEVYGEVVGTEAPEDPWEQLRGAIEAVFRSWNTPRAKAYRRHEGIPEDLGTAVTVQAMVFGNLSEDSATGVIFTRNPATGENAMYGDILFGAQGEDVVAGTHGTEPISVLEGRMPELAARLAEYADRLERHYRDVCDIEFTIEDGLLWMLQTRIGKRSPQAALRIAIDMAEDPDFPLTREEAVERVARHLIDPPTTSEDARGDAEPLTTALGASPGTGAGRVATSADTAVEMAEAGLSVILVRPETSPDDVHGMARAAGILTSTGGLASHAAVVARGWGIPAVVGASEVRVTEATVTIGGQTFSSEDSLTIDGSTGEVFAGALVGERKLAPEAETLMAWAEEAGIEIGASGQAAPAGGSASGGPTPEAALHALFIKGFVMPDGAAMALMCSEEEAEEVLEALADEGLAKESGGMFQLTDAGKGRAAESLAADREAWGPERAEAGLDGFLPLDARMKVIVTAWQMREVNGEQVINDHSDAEYDAGVLADFAELAAEGDEWLAPLCGELPRLTSYRNRLAAAAEKVSDGDPAYIASPRVDSYHNIWFELHEDLIQLAGRTREDEVAAGRA